jgi:hypothetical protein
MTSKQEQADRKFADAWEAHVAGGKTVADFARALGIAQRNVYQRRRDVEQRLGITLASFVGPPHVANRVRADAILDALHGNAPEHDMVHTVPEPFVVKGVSTLYATDKETGEQRIAAQWVKSTQDRAAREALLREAAEAFASQIPRAKPTKVPARRLDDALLNLYTVTDFHIGMLAWGEETGADWDTSIAEEVLVSWFERAIAQSPPARVAAFAQLGDLLHYDGLEAVTPTSKNVLDADTRFQKVVRVAIRVLRRVISMLLAKYERVYVLMAEGNHDIASSVWLREWFAALYENEPRAIVDRSPDPYYCIEHGKTALFFHHGHLSKIGKVDAVLAGKFREVFGRTKHNYAHVGHLHHIEVKETSLMVIEQHRTLASPDAYASRGGWLAGRDAQVITYHDEWGEVGRVRISAAMVAAARRAA